MNHYGQMAREHWARWLPARYAMIQDPDSFFSDLGSQADSEIDHLAPELAGDDQPGRGLPGQGGPTGRGTAPGRADRPGRGDPAGPGAGSGPDEDDSPEPRQPWGLDFLYPEDSPET